MLWYNERKKGVSGMSTMKITNHNFQEKVIQEEKPVLVDFWASWCRPCKMISPVVDEIAAEMEEIRVGKVNIDEELELAKQFKVMSIPTLLLFKKGKVVGTSVGLSTKQDILKMIQSQ